MDIILYINPEGDTVEIPAADAKHFDELGWPRAEAAETKKKKTTTNK